MAKDKSEKLQRLDKCVAHITGLSRAAATRLIKDGDVSVAGEVLTDAASKISLNAALVIVGFNDDDVEDEVLTAASAFDKRVFMLNKPFDFVCADRDKNHRIIASLFGQELKSENLHSAGRLDIDTTGLLIVTDDGDLIHDITSPKKAVNKLYYARLDKAIPQAAVAKFKSGLKHPEEKKRYLPAVLTVLPVIEEQGQEVYRACVEISEGRYHEVKRLFELVGCEVIELARLAIGSLSLKSELNLGDYMQLTPEELESIKEDKLYSEEEMMALVDQHEQAMLESPLTFIPERCRNLLAAAHGADQDVVFSEEDEAFLVDTDDFFEKDGFADDIDSLDR